MADYMRENRMSHAFRTLLVAVVVLSGLFLSGTSSATVIVYADNKTGFVFDTDPTRATGTIPNIGAVAQPFTLGTVKLTTVATGGLFVGALGAGTPTGDWTIFNPGNDMAISGIENLDAEFVGAAPVYAAGFDFVEPTRNKDCFATCFESTFEITVYSGATSLGTFSWQPPNDTLAFWGVWTDVPITKLSVREVVGNIDDEFFGEFYTSTTPVPEPGTWAMLAAGLILVVFSGARRASLL